MHSGMSYLSNASTIFGDTVAVRAANHVTSRVADAFQAARSLIERAARRSKRGNSHFLDVVTAGDAFSPPVANTTQLLKLYNQSPWVRSIVGKVGATVAKHRFYFETADGTRVDKHPALDFLRRGAPKLRGPAAIKTTAVHVDLTGEAFWLVGRGKGNTPTHYAVIPPTWVMDTPDTDEGFYDINPANGPPLRVAASEMIHFRDPDPLRPYDRGSSLTGAAYTEISTDLSASKFLDAFLKNSARPDLIISGTEESPLDNVSRARAEEAWMNRHAGPSKAGRPYFSSRPLEIKELGKSLKDNAVPEVRTAARAIISEIYNIPPEVLGRLDNSNRATIDAADLLFGRHTIDPRLAFLRDQLTDFLATNFNLEGLTLKYDNPVDDDRAHGLAVTKAHPKFFSGNEVRKLAGLRPVPGLDDLPEDEPDPSPEDMQSADDAATDEPKKRKRDDKAVKAIRPEDIVDVAGAVDDPQVRAELTRLLEALYVQLIARYGTELLHSIEADVRFELNTRVLEFLRQHLPHVLDLTGETTTAAIREALETGLANSEATAALEARIAAVFQDASNVRAGLIGATDATRITGFAALEAAYQGGFAEKEWLNSGDTKVRDTHVAMNGQVKPVSEPFVSPSGARGQHPGAFGSAKEDINCRCAIRPVLPSEKAERVKMAHEPAYERTSDDLERAWRRVFKAQKFAVLAAFRRATGAYR